MAGLMHVLHESGLVRHGGVGCRDGADAGRSRRCARHDDTGPEIVAGVAFIGRCLARAVL